MPDATPVSVDDLLAIIQRESETVELKTGASEKPLQEAMVAFSNSDGGRIFIGVDDDKKIVGRPLDHATDTRIHSAAAEAHDLGRYSVRELDVDGVPVVEVRVQRREQGFSQTSNGRLLVRRGARNLALVGHEAWEHIVHRAYRRFEQADSDVDYKHVDAEALEKIRDSFGWPENGGVLDRLQEQGLVLANGRLTIAGCLCLTDPRASLSTGKFVVEVLRYSSEQGLDYNRRVEFGGPVFSQVDQAASFIGAELGTDQVVTGLYRHDLPRLPPRVIREALANAVAHRSYEIDAATIRVEIRPMAVSVTSPGRLPEPVTIETMRYSQAARNQSVLKVLRAFRLAEDNGQGVDLMQDQMRDALLDPPVFEEVGNSVRVTLSLQGPITPRERAWLLELVSKGALMASDQLILVHAARGVEMTNSEVRRLTRVDRVEATQALQRLRDTGLLVQHGTRGGATYSLAETIAPAAAYRMSEQEIEALVLHAARHPVRNADIRALTGLDRAETRSLLARLVEAGRLTQQGQTRSTTYVRPDDAGPGSRGPTR